MSVTQDKEWNENRLRRGREKKISRFDFLHNRCSNSIDSRIWREKTWNWNECLWHQRSAFFVFSFWKEHIFVHSHAKCATGNSVLAVKYRYDLWFALGAGKFHSESYFLSEEKKKKANRKYCLKNFWALKKTNQTMRLIPGTQRQKAKTRLHTNLLDVCQFVAHTRYFLKDLDFVADQLAVFFFVLPQSTNLCTWAWTAFLCTLLTVGNYSKPKHRMSPEWVRSETNEKIPSSTTKQETWKFFIDTWIQWNLIYCMNPGPATQRAFQKLHADVGRTHLDSSCLCVCKILFLWWKWMKNEGKIRRRGKIVWKTQKRSCSVRSRQWRLLHDIHRKLLCRAQQSILRLSSAHSAPVLNRVQVLSLVSAAGQFAAPAQRSLSKNLWTTSLNQSTDTALSDARACQRLCTVDFSLH